MRNMFKKRNKKNEVKSRTKLEQQGQSEKGTYWNDSPALSVSDVTLCRH
jgi:hypothetical protein